MPLLKDYHTDTDRYLNKLFLFELNTSHSHSFACGVFFPVEKTHQRSAYGNLRFRTSWKNKSLDKNALSFAFVPVT